MCLLIAHYYYILSLYLSIPDQCLALRNVHTRVNVLAERYIQAAHYYYTSAICEEADCNQT